MKTLGFLRKMTIFASQEMLFLRNHFSQESKRGELCKTFANFLKVCNTLRIKKLKENKDIKTLHLGMKRHGICEK